MRLVTRLFFLPRCSKRKMPHPFTGIVRPGGSWSFREKSNVMELAVTGSRKPPPLKAACPTGRLSTSSRLGNPLRETGEFLSVLAPALAFLAIPSSPTEHVDRDKAVSGNPGLCMSLQGQRRVKMVSDGLFNGWEA